MEKVNLLIVVMNGVNRVCKIKKDLCLVISIMD